MSRQIFRNLTVTVGPLGEAQGLKIKNLRVAVSTTQTSDLKKNNGSIKIYNAEKSLIKELASSNKRLGVTVRAGYDGVEEPVFAGVVSGMYLDAQAADIVLVIRVVDGVLHASNTMFSKSYKGKVRVFDIMKDIVSTMQERNNNLIVAKLPENDTKTYKNGFAWCGTAGDCLTKICHDHKLTWFINNDQLYITEPDAPLVTTTVPLLKNTSGLLGSPQFYEGTTGRSKTKIRERGISFTCRLNPEVKVGYEVRVESMAFNDNYLIKELKLDLDNAKGNFSMNCIGINEWI